MTSSYGYSQNAYNRGYGYLRTKKVKKDDFIIVQFTPAVSIRKVFVDTGSYIAPADRLQSAIEINSGVFVISVFIHIANEKWSEI